MSQLELRLKLAQQQSSSHMQASPQKYQSFSKPHNAPNTIKSQNFVIQKYVESPLLIDKRKFDIRLWVMVNQDGKCYYCKQGYVRLTGEEYKIDQDTLSKPSVHLTNNAVQKHTQSYGKYEEGNILSFK